MKLALGLGYWSAGPPSGAVEQVAAAEDLGFDSMWSAEAYGSDALTPLAWWGAATERIGLGTSICQISARTPAAMAMAAMTMDHLSGGRFRLGLGASGPQVVEGWYGQPFAKPVSRTREYIDIIRQVMRREGPVSNDGPHYTLPYTGEGSWGLGKPLKPITHPLRADLPIYLGAEGPKNVAMGAELCDGWFPLWYSPYKPELYADSLKGAKPGFEIVQTMSVVINDNVEEALQAMKPALGFYVGGMGAKDKNFHKDLMARFGYEEEAQKIQDLFFEGKRGEAIAAVPDAFVDEISLVGSPERIRDRLQAWRDSPVTTLSVHGDVAQLRKVAELVNG